MQHEYWQGFKQGNWQDSIDVRDFIQTNYTEYTGNDEFLSSATTRTKKIMQKVNDLFLKERKAGGVLDVDVETVSSLNSYAPGYIDKENEIIVGMQTDAPLKRGVNPFGGMRMVKQACEAHEKVSVKWLSDKFYRITAPVINKEKQEKIISSILGDENIKVRKIVDLINE